MSSGGGEPKVVPNTEASDNSASMPGGGGNPVAKESEGKRTSGGKAREPSETPPPQSQPSAPERQSSFQPHLPPFPYYAYQQGTPTPTPPSPTITPGGYDIQHMLLQQQAAMAQQQAAVSASPFGRQYNSGIPPPPLSPAPSSANNGGGTTNNIPPASPLFPTAPLPLNHLDSPSISRMAQTSMASPLSPLPYLTPQVIPNSPIVAGYGGVYQGDYGGVMGTASHRNPNSRENPASPDSGEHGPKAWAQNVASAQQQQGKSPPNFQPQASMQQYQVGLVPSDSNHSSQSFDELLPPSIGGRDRSGGYLIGGGPGGGGTLFANPQPWGGYGNPNRGMYGVSHLQQQGHGHMVGGPRTGGYLGRPVGPPMGGMPGGHNVGPPYYAATTPGPPIQTTPSNKGPDGANLFIFHIPNHFTNLDMYNLFCHYGNLLSVRIMVEKDTGRSRGFGFVSYDSPESAAMAIKELNGFVIGNKRLKVQHKQIRASDHAGQQQQQQQQHHGGYHQHNIPPAGKQDLRHGGMRVPDPMIPVGEGREGSPSLPNWYGDSKPSSSAPHSFSPTEGSSGASGQSPFQALDENATADHFRKDAALGLSPSSIPCDKGQPVSPEENANERMKKIQQHAGLLNSSADGGLGGPGTANSSKVLPSAAGNSSSPLGHLESIRNALPDISK